MRIVLFGALTNNSFDRSECKVDIYPSPFEQLHSYTEKYPLHQFFIVTTPGHLFLVNQGESRRYFEEGGARFCLLPESSTAQEYVKEILKVQPDLAIAMTFPGVPVDGNTLMDAVIAEELRRQGIKTYAHSIKTAQIFSDKWQSHLWFEQQCFPVAKAVHIPQFIYQLEQNKKVFPANAFKALAEYKMKQLHYPVVIKGCFTSASIGVQIAETYEEAVEKIASQDGGSDLLVEEKVEGIPYGAEIHGYPGHYTVTNPFKLSTGDDGISSATDNLKGGPLQKDEDQIPVMKAMLLDLAEKAGLEGNAQVDLFLTEEGWKILEVNPRISGMTILTGAAEGHSILETLIDPLLDPEGYRQSFHESTGMSLRIPIQHEAVCRKLMTESHVFNIWQNDNAMLRNCQITLGGYASGIELVKHVIILHQQYPEIFTENVVIIVKKFFNIVE